MQVGIDAGSVGDWLGSAKTAVELLKAAAALMPKGKNRDDIAASLAEAEQALARSDAALAKQLGYQLCQCSFPPRIMLWREAEGVLACPDPNCGSMKRPARAAPPTPLARIDPAKQCPLCQAEMRVKEERSDPTFGVFGHKIHLMECTCGHKTDRRFVPGEGYK